MEFRKLRADEIECRVSQINQYGASLLLYKDARCDMRILDETVKPQNWQREHKTVGDVVYCGVSIKCNTLGGDLEWVTKWDAGAESYTEKEKGQASDSFKRACFNWGLGRELYTAPNIRVKPKKNGDKEDIYKDEKKGKYVTWTKFSVSDIEYTNDVISYVEIIDQDGTVRYRYGEIKPITKEQHKYLINNLKDEDITKWCAFYKVKDVESLPYRSAQFIIDRFNKSEGR